MADIQESSFDANTTENNEDMEIVTMVDVLKEEQELEADACAVLGGSDEKNCTYSKGYLKRQALYACVTCIPESKSDPTKRAGICLACSYSCHEGHDLIELYTRRNFRCDCGNSKFPGKQCNLDNDKAEINEENIYSHNFSGLYCTCERPYPDPEDKVVDEMIQCIICEDWYHCRHLGSPLPPLNSYSEMICSGCIAKHEFLLNYSGYTVTTVKEEENKENDTAPEVKAEIDVNISKEETGNLNVTAEAEAKEQEPECKMPKIKCDEITAKFWVENWRQHLCVCKDCLELYEIEKVKYLIDTQDTVHHYEEKGKAKALENTTESQNEKLMQALSSFDRVKQVEAITEYNSMKDQLKEYLQKFAENKKIVREEDIREFFSTMESRKKQRVEVPYFCR